MTMAIIVYLTLKHEPVTKMEHNSKRKNSLLKTVGVSSEGWFRKFNDYISTYAGEAIERFEIFRGCFD